MSRKYVVKLSPVKAVITHSVKLFLREPLVFPITDGLSDASAIKTDWALRCI